MGEIYRELAAKQREAEWQFMTGVFGGSADVAIRECAWLLPDMISEQTLKEYWDRVLNQGADPLTAATDLKLISEFLSRSAYAPAFFQMSEVARQIGDYYFLKTTLADLTEVAKAVQDGDPMRTRTLLEGMLSKSSPGSHNAFSSSDIHAELSAKLANMDLSMSTGIPELDSTLGKLFATEMTIVASRPGVGKTAITAQIARNVARSGKRVLVFPTEMNRLSWWARFACPLAGVSWKDVRSMDVIPDPLLKRIVAESEKLQKLYGDNLLVQDEVFTAPEMHAIAARYNPDLVIVDHLGEMQWHNAKVADDEVKWFGKAARYLRQHIAKALKCHLILVHQLNRSVEARKSGDKVPQLHDLKWSGDLEAAADAVLMLYRPDMQNSDPDMPLPTKVPAEAWTRKNRFGVNNACANLEYDLFQQWYDSPRPIVPYYPQD